MPRKRKKPSNTTRSHLDYGLHKKVKKHSDSAKRSAESSEAAYRRSQANKNSTKGTDGVDYSGDNRVAHNLGRMYQEYHNYKSNKAQSEIDKRNEKRKRNALRIRGRQRPLQ